MRHRSDGQLALLDAMVFFAISVVVSSVMLSYGKDSGDMGLDPCEGTSDPEMILEAFLNACLGSPVTIRSHDCLTIPERTKVSACLALEVEAMMDGFDPDVFVDLNDAYTIILRRITNPVFEPHLAVLDSDGGDFDAVLMLPQNSQLGSVVLVASAVLPCGEHSCLVEVLLSAQSLPEPVNI